MLKLFTALAFAFLAASTASAHPGHGAATTSEAGYSLLHFATEPLHLASVLGACAVAAAAAAAHRRNRVQKHEEAR